MNIKKTNKIIVPVLLLVFICLAYSSALQKSPTFDEPIHLTGGYSALVNSDYRIDPTGGILTGVCAALPLVFDSKIKPINSESKWWAKCDDIMLAEEFLRKNDIDHLFLWSRFMMIIVGALGGLAVYFASRQIWGDKGALITLFVYVLSPTILAHTRFIVADLISAVFFFLSAWTFWNLLNKFTWQSLLMTCLSLSGLALAKLSGVLILPVLICIAAIHLVLKKKWRIKFCKSRYVLENPWQRSGVILLIFVFIGIFVVTCIWGAYGFRYSMLSDESGRDVLNRVWPFMLSRDYVSTKVIGFFREYKLLPEGYIFGFAAIFKKAFEGSYSFLNGQYSTSGWRSFFPLAFLYKTPISIIILVIIGLVSPFVIQKNSRRRKALRVWYISFPVALILVYGYFAVTSKLNIGHRHLLPIYLPLFVLLGGAAMILKKEVRWGQIIICLLLTGLLLDCLIIYPDYLAYFNPVAGGSAQGYKHLVDSSLDWGQDIKLVQRWLDKERSGQNAYIAYFGSVNLDDYGIKQKRLFCHTLQKKNTLLLRGGTYCISATMLQMVYSPGYVDWNSELQKNYIHSREQALLFYKKALKGEAFKEFIAKKGEKYWMNICSQYDMLRFAKLMNALRKRQPDHMIGYSYLIFELTDEEVQKILNP